MVLFLFSFKDITDTHGKGHHSSKKDGRLPAPVAKKNVLLFAYSEHDLRAGRPAAPGFHFLRALLFITVTFQPAVLFGSRFLHWTHTVFLHQGVSLRWRCVFKWNLVTVCCKYSTFFHRKWTLPSIPSATQHYPSGVFTVTVFYLWCTNFNNCVTEDKKHRRKSGSRFSEARKRGRTMLYQLTSQFSRGGKREVNLGGVSTFFLFFYPQILLCTFLFTLQEKKKRSYSGMQCPQSPVWIINADI